MTTERVIRIVAGAFVILSVILGARSNGLGLSEPSWFWFTLFVGANLFQSGITRWCLMESLLIKAGVKKGGACGTC